MTSTDEKKKTAINTKSEILDARVIANYGDPGLDEDYHFDILSRYVIVMIESCDRILTMDKRFQMIAVVQRPAHLWIQAAGGLAASRATQKRSDVRGNINTGLSSNYAVKGIPRINQAYQLGETIKIRRLPTTYTAATYPAFFKSDFNIWTSDTFQYNGWHSEGSSLPYINNDPDKILGLTTKTIEPVAGDPNWNFNFYLNKLQYEIFMLNNNNQNSALVDTLTKIFSGQWFKGTPVYSAHGGYAFYTNNYLLFSACGYEDINVSNKMRTSSNECMPLIVAAPERFPTPKQRVVSTIAYNPTYSTIFR